jgi:hypothetical protein
MIGGVDREEILTDESFLNSPERRPEHLQERLIDNLPGNGSVQGEIEFHEMDDEELDVDSYSGLDELESAYQTWMAEYDQDSEVLMAEVYQGNNGGEFEIRLEEIENLHTREWTGPHHPNRYHDRSGYDELGGRESVRRMETGDTLAVLRGEYRREV